MKIFLKIAFWNCFLVYILCLSNATTEKTTEEDYYMNYDYEFSSNNTDDSLEMRSDSLILPNPESLDSRYAIDVLPNVELPDDSLADTDLRDHDFIDNLMYVYYGSATKNGTSYGPEIIIIGSVLSCAAQLLTIFCVLLRKNINSAKKESNLMFLHMMGSLCVSNLLFMLGVHATKGALKCQIIALMLHYLHLLSAFWFFTFSYFVYRRFCHSTFPLMKHLVAFSYGSPVVLTLISFILSPMSYETKRFCFISVSKGMIINYMLPVSTLIVLTTLYCLNGIRKINLELSKLELNSSAESLNALKNELEGVDNDKRQEDVEIISLRESKRCLKTLCVVQTSYDIVWFVAVLALENVNYSNGMSIVYSVTCCLLNWYIFARATSFIPTLPERNDISTEASANQDQEKPFASSGLSTNRRGSSDSIPLLVNSESCTELRELRQECICTISS